MIRASIFIAALLLCGCGTPTASTPSPVNSPQTQAINIDKTMADAINSAVKISISLRCATPPAAGCIDPGTVILIENWAKSAASLDDQIAAELANSDTWDVQKQKILLLLPKLQIPIISGLNPTAQTALTVVTSLISQIQAQVTQQ